MENNATVRRTFKKRAATTDKGKDYEDLTVVSLILELLKNNFKNFDVWSNDRLFGAFDDVIVEMEARDVEKFAVQLKHIDQKSKQMSLASLTEEKGNFSIKKYFKSFRESTDVADYNLILATNLKFALKKKVQLQLAEAGEVFQIEIIESEANPILNSSKESTKCYKFRIIQDIRIMPFSEILNEYENFFEKFYLYPNQKNVEELKNEVREELKSIFSNDDISEKFLKFIKDWGMREGIKETLTKEIMEKVIVLLMMSSSIHPIFFCEVKPNAKILQRAVSEFGVSVFGEESLEGVRRLFGDVKTETTEEELEVIAQTYQISFDQNDSTNYTKLLWLMNKCPLIIQESSLAHKAMELSKSSKFILIQQKSQEFPKCDVFQKLSDLKSHGIFKNLIENFKVSLPEGEVNLKCLLQENEEFQNVITTDELLIMADGIYKIQDQKEEIPVPYINRLFSKNIFNLTYLNKIDNETLILISSVTEEDVKILKKFRPIFVEDDQEEISSYIPRIYISKNILSNEDFLAICKRKKSAKICHHFKFSNGCLEWLLSRPGSDMSKLHQYRTNREDFVEETDLPTTQNNILHIVTGDPGIGKSCWLRNLKNNSSETWTVLFSADDAEAICNFFRKHNTFGEEFLNFILEMKYCSYKSFDKLLLKLMIQKSRATFLWDALDEIVSEKNMGVVAEIINFFFKKGIVQWITSRTHLTDFLEDRFSVLSRKICQFNENQQDYYIQIRLKPVYKEEKEILEIIAKIKKHVVVVKHIDILSIPLQLYMLTELCLKNNEKFQNLFEESFTVINLYQYFIEEKFNFFYKDKIKVEDSKTDDLKPTQKAHIREFEAAALRAILERDILTDLKITDDDDVLESDSFGFVTEAKTKIKFAHISYAEYFAARYFSRRKFSKLKDILFKARYRNVRFFFDLLLANDSPGHVAVLYGDFSKVNDIHEKDSGGRNLLQTMCSWGENYPTVKFRKSDQLYVLDDKEHSVKAQSLEYENTLKILLDKLDLFSAEDIFKMSSLEYAEKSNSLFSLVVIEEKLNIGFLNSRDENFICSVLYYSVILHQERFIPLFKNYINCIRTKTNESLLHLAVQSGDGGTVIQLLQSGADVNAADKAGITPLHLAAENDYQEIVSNLVRFNAEVDSLTIDGLTPLMLSCIFGHEETVKLLVELGADFLKGADESLHFPLILATTNGNEKVVEVLIGLGAVKANKKFSRISLNVATSRGYDKVASLIEKALTEAETDNESSLKTFELLVQSGVDINDLKTFGWPILHFNCWCGNEMIVEHLIKLGIDVNVLNDHSATALQVAASKNFVFGIKALIDSGAEIDSRDAHGTTPLIEACIYGGYDAAQLLISSGADVDAVDKNGLTPLGAAFYNNHKKIYDMLIEKGAKVEKINLSTPLYVSCEIGFLSAVKAFIKMGTDVDVVVYNGWRAIHIASYNGFEEVVQELVEVGADIDAVTSGGDTAADLARENGHVEIVKFLEEYVRK